MRFLPLPRSTLRFVAIATVLLLTWLAWATFKYPDTLWAPGDLSRFHADIADCHDCHQPFRGVTADNCIACHEENHFAARLKPSVSELHQKLIRERKSCLGCHTEHRGALAQITLGALANPHGEFVFRVTGTRSCSACHDFGANFRSPPKLLDNAMVRRLMQEGEGEHRPGAMANCLTCHQGGRLDADEGQED